MQIFLIIIHVIACLFLIAVILLQAGRGGGMSDIAGGSQAQSILGTETNVFMKRMTEVFAIIFIITSLSLGIISTHRGKSLMEQKRMASSSKRSPLTQAEVAKAMKEVAQAKNLTPEQTTKALEKVVAAAGGTTTTRNLSPEESEKALKDIASATAGTSLGLTQTASAPTSAPATATTSATAATPAQTPVEGNAN